VMSLSISPSKSSEKHDEKSIGCGHLMRLNE
jgi:hypothetical protein